MADQREAPDRPVVIVSNRGPVSYREEAGELVIRRGAGGLVTSLAPLAGNDATWIAAAISDADRAAARRGAVDTAGFRVRLLDVDPDIYRLAYDVVSNETLWFVHHHLFELARRPRFDTDFATAWAAYRAVNSQFADAVAEEAPDGAAVLVQDYHLTLLAPQLRDQRPDLRLVHFSHTPFAVPDLLRVLPAEPLTEMLDGMAEHDACGFHSARWAASFIDGCREMLARAPKTFVAPLAPDPADLQASAAMPDCDAALAALETAAGDRRVIVRVDRIELSKNLLRGFHAFDDMLERHEQWRGRVMFAAFCYPSREGLPEYLAYRHEVEWLVRQLNDKWGTDDWTPILFDAHDHYPSAVAALRRYDVLLVNPIRDGLNLVAKEGPILNEHDGIVVLSTEAGAFDELEGAVRAVNPFDVSATADALASALATSADERRREAAELERRAKARSPQQWLTDQLAAAD
jgi:trehalose 6-phosphate synthase